MQSDLEERLRADDKKALEEVYKTYKEAFINYCRTFEIDDSDVLDIYQDSIVAMYQSFVIKKTVLKSSSLKTYLFGIGKHKVFTFLKEKNKTTVYKADETIPAITTDDTFLTEQQQLLEKKFLKMGKSCQEILKLFYYRGFTIKDIVAHTHYTDENTVKSHKSRCLKQLRARIIKR